MPKLFDLFLNTIILKGICVKRYLEKYFLEM